MCVSLNAEYTSLQFYRDTLVSRLERSAAAQRYLETVAETAQEFHEIHEVVARHTTLVSTQQVIIIYAVSERYPNDLTGFHFHLQLHLVWPFWGNQAKFNLGKIFMHIFRLWRDFGKAAAHVDCLQERVMKPVWACACRHFACQSYGWIVINFPTGMTPGPTMS